MNLQPCGSQVTIRIHFLPGRSAPEGSHAIEQPEWVSGRGAYRIDRYDSSNNRSPASGRSRIRVNVDREFNRVSIIHNRFIIVWVCLLAFSGGIVPSVLLAQEREETPAEQSDSEESHEAGVLPDSLRLDPDISSAFRMPWRGSWAARPFLRTYPRLYYISLPGEQVEVERLPGGDYLARQRFFDTPVGVAGLYRFDEYLRASRSNDIRENWQELVRQPATGEPGRGSLLDVRLSIPGGRESTFTSIFGRPEVNLRVNGMAQMNAGATIQQTADPSLPPDQQTRIDPRFGQNLQLNIQGTVGDKLTIRTDWDTERTFDYQNLFQITYEGYEDEILQRVEMGNVSMQTGNSLIRGSGSLFGILSEAQFGSLRVMSVLSQQKGENQVQTITGGAQDRPVRLQPADYEDNRHFFLDFYTRQEFEQSMSNPQQRIQTLRLAEVQVWVMSEQVQTEEGSRRAVALSDLGVVEQPGSGYGPPDNELDRFGDEDLSRLRDPEQGVSASDIGLDDPRDLEEGYFRLLREGEEYTVDRVSGFVSLRRELQSREVLAVSYIYQDPAGEPVTVGEMAQGGSERLVLKLIRPQNLSTDHKLFPLVMRNVYSLGATNLTQDNIDLELLYTEENVSRDRLTGRPTTLLQDLGLDRVDSRGGVQPDNQVDLNTGTLDALTGRVIFPWLEPFGSRMEELLLESGATSGDIERVVYPELYSEQKRNAERASQNSYFRISGNVRGGVQQNFTLDFALVEGSVRVYANGMQLQEGVDYQVDYSFGSITILNDRYMAPGQEIRIEYENQALTAIEQKTFTGLRAEYSFSDEIYLGGTWFRYSERPLDDKIRIGDEPISNMMFGLDTALDHELPFLSDAIDALPLIETRAPSRWTLTGEFAHLMPGVSETRAVRRAIENNELYPDEEQGVSFVDDFEGSSIKINLLNPMRWNLSAAPAVIPGMEGDAIYFEDPIPAPATSPLDLQAERNDLRGHFAWYTIPRNIASILDGVEFTPESRPVRVQDLFPGRQTYNPQEEIIPTLDLFFDPRSRGQYNYNMDLRTLLEEEPERTWGGMTAVLPSGQEDFSQNNIEFLEFWVQPVLPNGQTAPASMLDAYDGKLYVDVGTVSEDVIPNAKVNSEDGLATNTDLLMLDRPSGPRSILPSNPPPPVGQFSVDNRELEDVGLDGLASVGGVNGWSEQTIFTSFIDQMRVQFGEGSEEFESILVDPSNDGYRFYGESDLQDLPLHERFHRMMGFYDGNTPLDQGETRAVTNRPNTEGLVNPSRVELNNAYFQYELALNPARFESERITDRVEGSRPEDRWYQVRIPLEEFARKVGDIEDFQNITYVRVWLSGYEHPFTLRFASLEFTGSQWQKDEERNLERDPGASLQVSTVNIEENSNRRPVPYRQPRGGIRAQNRGSQLQSLQNEQSMLLQVNGLGPESLQMIRRTFPGGMNMLHYSNLRMFVHGEGFEERGDAELVVRMGHDLENAYYEYRQPVTPTDLNFPWQSYDPADNARLEEEARRVWLYSENSMNILLEAFNQLKQLRDQDSQGNPGEVYERSDLLEDAVPGAVIAVRGNPSLDRVSEIGLGIRNPYSLDRPNGPGRPVLNGQFWLNELRVSGFDNRSGWAANARTSLELADVATIHSGLNRQTDGFGALNSRLGDRRMSDQTSWDVNSTLLLHRFLPERYGWSIPLNLSTRRSVLTPRYLPDEGDIRLADYKQAIRNREELSEEIQNTLIRQKIQEIQTYNDHWSVQLSNLSKRGSESRFLHYTLDRMTFSYIYNQGHGRNPQYRFLDNWNLNSSLRYQHTVRNQRYVAPFRFLESIPILTYLSDSEIGLLPTQFSSSIRLSRSYEERRRRDRAGEGEPLQQTHSFSYQTDLGVRYNLFRSLQLGFQNQAIFDLTGISQMDRTGAGIDSTAFRMRSTFRVLEDLLTDQQVQPRQQTYQESYNGGWQPGLSHIPALSWTSYSLRYNGGFRWENSPIASNLGSRLGNSFRLDHTLRFDLQQLLQRWGWLQGVREQSREPLTDDPERVAAERVERIAQRMLLGVFSLQSVEVGYSDSRTGSQAGFSGGSGFFEQFGSSSQASPSLLYRIGYRESISPDRLIDGTDQSSVIQIPANNTWADHWTVRTLFSPLPNVSLELNWEIIWDERASRTTTLDPLGENRSVEGASGNSGSSVWAFGSGYRDLFERQLQTAFDGMEADSDTLQASGGRRVLNRMTLQEDVRASWLNGGGSVIGKRNFTPLPMPGWRINWTGIENLIPILGNWMERATLTHGYQGNYRMGWNFNSQAGEFPTRRLGSYLIEDVRPEIEPNSLNIEHRFSPLVQLSVIWSQVFRMQVGYELNKLTSMALSNVHVTERISRGVTSSFTYTFRNVNLPFIRPLNNNLDLTLSGNLVEDSEQRFMLEADLANALNEPPEVINRDPNTYRIHPRPPTGQTRIHASAVVGYRFSTTFQANFEYAFSHTLPRSSQTFRRTLHDFRFSLRINFRSV
ncbi:MAG: cell surface protein SprA [Balneolaceae bacterium]